MLFQLQDVPKTRLKMSWLQSVILYVRPLRFVFESCDNMLLHSGQCVCLALLETQTKHICLKRWLITLSRTTRPSLVSNTKLGGVKAKGESDTSVACHFLSNGILLFCFIWCRKNVKVTDPGKGRKCLVKTFKYDVDLKRGNPMVSTSLL